jgi:hypothetical protein
MDLPNRMKGDGGDGNQAYGYARKKTDAKQRFHRRILTLKKFNLHLLYIYLKLKDSYPCG